MTKVWVTRDEDESGPLCGALRAAGLEPVCEPVVERRQIADAGDLIAGLRESDWLVLTSEFALRAMPAGVRCRVAVVGEPSRAAAEAQGLTVALVSPDGTGRGMWGALRELAAPGARVCHPRSSLAEPAPAWDGVRVESPVLYETVARGIDPKRLEGVTIAAVASPSAAREAVTINRGLRFASIGPTTSAALRELGVEPWARSAEPTFTSLAAAIRDGLSA